MYRMNKTKLLTSRLSKVIAFQTCIHTPPKLYTTPLGGWSLPAYDHAAATGTAVTMSPSQC